MVHPPTAAAVSIRLAPAELTRQLEQLPVTQEQRAPDEFSLITRRHVQTHNSWTHNLQEFLDRLGGRNHVYMHPLDARDLQLEDAQLVTVSNDNASIRLPVSLCDDLLRGVVAVPHGWGHQSSGNKTARQSSGVNVNLLALSGSDHVDPVSGMSQLTDIRVRITPASQAAGAADWSGVA